MVKIIAIDGPAASGKTSIGKCIAEDLDYLFFDTGIMYRALTWAALSNNLSPKDEDNIVKLIERIEIDIRTPSKEDGRQCDVLIDEKDVTWEIREPLVDENVSDVAAHPEVRKALTAIFRRIGLRGDVVMVGRDVGTIILPEADLKIYLDASLQERARRRFLEATERNKNISYDEIITNLSERDQIDSTRSTAPLRPAADSVIINTDKLNKQEVINIIKSYL